MPQKAKSPVAGRTASGAGTDAVARGAAGTNNSTPSQCAHPQKLDLRECCGRPDYWLVRVDELSEFPIRRTKLCKWRRFRNVARHHLSVEFPEAAPISWTAMVTDAVSRAEGSYGRKLVTA
jgi:hypothetical protein